MASAGPLAAVVATVVDGPTTESIREGCEASGQVGC
jgi:hypothetical protein